MPRRTPITTAIPRVAERRTRGKSAFKQTDITRAIKAAEAAGKVVSAVTIMPTGEIKLTFGEAQDQEPNPWDDHWKREIEL